MNKTRVLRFLYHSVIVGAGFATLALEMTTSRILSPYFGTGLDTWGAILVVSLTALAVGYFWGEHTVRKYNADRLPAAFAGRAFLAVLFSLAGVAAIYPVCAETAGLPSALGAIIASAVLVLPCFILTSSLTPILAAIEIMTAAAENRDKPEKRGKTGIILAESTLGSVAGALICVYLLIPAMTVEGVIICTMIPLFFAASSLLVGHRMFMTVRVRIFQISVILAAGFFIFTGKTADAKFIDFGGIRAEQAAIVRTGYGTVRVLQTYLPDEDIRLRYFLIDGRTQGKINATTGTSVVSYTNATVNMLLNNPAKIKSALILGGASGSIARDLFNAGVKTDVVDIIPQTEMLAKKFFYVPDGVRFIVSDARPFLNKCTTKYDAIVFDVFGGYGVPEHILTKEAFQATAKCLNPGGIVTLNILHYKENPEADADVKATLSSVFPYVDMYIPFTKKSPIINGIWIASDEPIDSPEFDGGNEPEFLKKELSEGWVYRDVPAGGNVSTDSYPSYVFAMKKTFIKEHSQTFAFYGPEVMKP